MNSTPHYYNHAPPLTRTTELNETMCAKFVGYQLWNKKKNIHQILLKGLANNVQIKKRKPIFEI